MFGGMHPCKYKATTKFTKDRYMAASIEELVTSKNWELHKDCRGVTISADRLSSGKAFLDAREASLSALAEDD
jgi:hypothetical protein